MLNVGVNIDSLACSSLGMTELWFGSNKVDSVNDSDFAEQNCKACPECLSKGERIDSSQKRTSI